MTVATTPQAMKATQAPDSATVDFGAPERFGAHVFRVEIPAASTEPVTIVEDYGYRGHEAGIPR